jgi:hypothetical protein
MNRHGMTAIFVLAGVSLWSARGHAQEVSTSAGSIASSSVGEVGVRKIGKGTGALPNPTGRLETRISNRIQSRIQNRIDRNYDPDAAAISTIGSAQGRIQRAVRGER